MMYFKSIYTGLIYEADTLPQFGGYELSTKQAYDEQTVEWNRQSQVSICK